MPLALASLQFGRLGRQIGNPLGLFADDTDDVRFIQGVHDVKLDPYFHAGRLFDSSGGAHAIDVYRKYSEFFGNVCTDPLNPYLFFFCFDTWHLIQYLSVQQGKRCAVVEQSDGIRLLRRPQPGFEKRR
jgi:hypothetical protein